MGTLQEQLVDEFKHALQRVGKKQGALAAEIGRSASQMSRLATGKDAWTVEIAAAVDAVLGSSLASLLLREAAPVDLYVAAPITGLAGLDMARSHDDVMRVVQVLREQIDNVYWPGEGKRSTKDLRDADLATEDNIAALSRAKAFLYLQLHEVVHPTSSLIELGIALGRRVHTTIVVDGSVSLPFMLTQNFEGVAGRIQQLPDPRFRAVDSVERAVGLMARDGRRLLGMAPRSS